MKTHSLGNRGPMLLLLSLFLSVNAGMGAQQFAVPPKAKSMQSKSEPVKQQAENAAQNKSVAEWFSKYDQIRRDAQMTPVEKSSAHKLLSAVLTDNDGDKTAARQLLTKMVSRYEKASRSLIALHKIPQTAQLQDGYLKYFQAGHNFFQQYLTSVSKHQDQAVVSKLQNARKTLALLDVSNKILDKKLRKQYNIQPYKY